MRYFTCRAQKKNYSHCSHKIGILTRWRPCLVTSQTSSSIPDLVEKIKGFPLTANRFEILQHIFRTPRNTFLRPHPPHPPTPPPPQKNLEQEIVFDTLRNFQLFQQHLRTKFYATLRKKQGRAVPEKRGAPKRHKMNK